MKNTKIALLLFSLLAAIQWIVPGKMIYDQESVLRNGIEYKFKTAPVDPVDAMRGRYVALSFNIEEYETSFKEIYQNGTEVFVVLTTDSSGFAAIERIDKTKPASGDFLQVNLSSSFLRTPFQILRLDLPFDRYYMEENKAPKAESFYREVNREGNEKEAYAVVRVMDGKSVISGLYVDAKPIESFLEYENSEKYKLE